MNLGRIVNKIGRNFSGFQVFADTPRDRNKVKVLKVMAKVMAKMMVKMVMKVMPKVIGCYNQVWNPVWILIEQFGSD